MTTPQGKMLISSEALRSQINRLSRLREKMIRLENECASMVEEVRDQHTKLNDIMFHIREEMKKNRREEV